MTMKQMMPKLMFVAFTLIGIATAIRISDVPGVREFQPWMILVFGMCAGMWLEKWRRPEEEPPSEETRAPAA
jgi:hypothetical protein